MVPCWQCGGTRADCSLCEGLKTVPIKRCPYRFVDVSAWDACRSLSMLEVGVLPGPGGWMNQSATWLEAVQIVAAHKRHYDEQRRLQGPPNG